MLLITSSFSLHPPFLSLTSNTESTRLVSSTSSAPQIPSVLSPPTSTPTFLQMTFHASVQCVISLTSSKTTPSPPGPSNFASPLRPPSNSSMTLSSPWPLSNGPSDRTLYPPLPPSLQRKALSGCTSIKSIGSGPALFTNQSLAS